MAFIIFTTFKVSLLNRIDISNDQKNLPSSFVSGTSTNHSISEMKHSKCAIKCAIELNHLSGTVAKYQFYFFFVFQKYVTEPLIDRSFKPSFQKETYLF